MVISGAHSNDDGGRLQHCRTYGLAACHISVPECRAAGSARNVLRGPQSVRPGVAPRAVCGFTVTARQVSAGLRTGGCTKNPFEMTIVCSVLHRKSSRIASRGTFSCSSRYILERKPSGSSRAGGNCPWSTTTVALQHPRPTSHSPRTQRVEAGTSLCRPHLVPARSVPAGGACAEKSPAVWRPWMSDVSCRRRRAAAELLRPRAPAPALAGCEAATDAGNRASGAKFFYCTVGTRGLRQSATSGTLGAS
jgi:hypothetical protein